MTYITKTQNRNDLTNENRRNIKRVMGAFDDIEYRMTECFRHPALALDTPNNVIDLLEEVATYVRGVGYGLQDIGEEYTANDKDSGDAPTICPREYSEELADHKRIYAKLTFAISKACEEARKSL